MDKNKFIFAAIFFIAVFALISPNFLKTGDEHPQTAPGFSAHSLSYSELMNTAHEGKIKSVILNGRNASGLMKSGDTFTSVLPPDARSSEQLTQDGVDVRVLPPYEPSVLRTILISWGPMILLIAVWVWFMRKASGGKGGAFSFGKSKARLHTGKGKRSVTFKDVAGIEEAKADLQEVVDFLKNPSKFETLGARIPKGVLLVGPPGTGKTLIARAVAGEANVPFFSISGSDFVEMFVGVGASRVRDMFEQGKKSAPCIIFIDEIDAMGRHRGAGIGGGNDEREQTLNQMLVEMDGFSDNEGIILIAATNRPDVLDPALLRPGRFDRQIVVPNADITGREAILAVHLRKITYASDVDVRTIARGTPGFSGAELENLCNEAALLAARRNAKSVAMRDFEGAKDKILMGDERRTLIMSEQEKRLTAYHEAGHALCALLEPASDPIHKATIIPRGRALGLVMRLPEGDRVSLTLEKILADLCVGTAGRVAEELIFGKEKVTTGAVSDIKMITKLARSMITEWGFSTKLGTIAYGDQQQEVFLGHSLGQGSGMSETTSRIVEEETKVIVDSATERATKIINDNIHILHAIARGLLDRETLNGAELRILAEGGTLPELVHVGLETEDGAVNKKNSSTDPENAIPALANQIKD